MKLIFILLVIVFPAHSSPGDYGSIANLGQWFTFGPVINCSLGKGDFIFSGGINIAYWNFNHGTPMGIDLGFERNENSENIVYTEFQTGAIFAGGSAGVIYDNKVGFGIQGSVWADALIGGTIRFRYLGSPFICPGFFL